MWFIIYIILLIFYYLVIILNYGFKLPSLALNKIGHVQYKLGTKLFGWKLNYPQNYISPKNRILIMANHSNYLDGFFILKYLSDFFPQHKVYIILKKSLGDIPIIGQVIKSNFICLNRDYEQDKVVFKQKFSEISVDSDSKQPSIVLIFPEGTIRCPETIQNSLDYCQTKSIQPFNYLLTPRIRGLELIQKLYKPEQVIDLTLIYDNQADASVAKSGLDMIMNKVPKSVQIEHQEITGNLNQESVYNIWKNKDEQLSLLDK